MEQYIKKCIPINSEEEFEAVKSYLIKNGYVCDFEYNGGICTKPIKQLYIDGRNGRHTVAHSRDASYAPISEPYVTVIPFFENKLVCRELVMPKPTYFEHNGKKYLREEVDMLFDKFLKPVEDA